MWVWLSFLNLIVPFDDPNIGPISLVSFFMWMQGRLVLLLWLFTRLPTLRFNPADDLRFNIWLEIRIKIPIVLKLQFLVCPYSFTFYFAFFRKGKCWKSKIWVRFDLLLHTSSPPNKKQTPKNSMNNNNLSIILFNLS